MKRGYIRSMVLGGLLIGSLAGLTACGSDSGVATPTGKVVKGPVSGATVKDKDGVAFTSTDTNGVFSMTHTGPYSTTGGQYVTLNADGTPGATVTAPDMKAPAGFSQITPLSTLCAIDPTVEAKLLAVLGVSDLKTIDFSVKTTANSAAVVLSETVGAVLATAKKQAEDAGASSAVLTALTNTVTAALIDAVKTMAASSIAPTAANFASSITAAVTTAVTNDPTVSAALNVAALNSAIATQTATAANGADALPANQPLPSTDTTGSTGGTGGTTGIH